MGNRTGEFMPNKYHAINRPKYEAFRARGCADCGATERIEAHHVEPKRYALSSAVLQSPAIYDAEEAKCVPLCGPCHRARHSKEGYKKRPDQRVKLTNKRLARIMREYEDRQAYIQYLEAQLGISSA
jgi:hypothetical protein